MLRHGDRGAEVRDLQVKLKSLGYARRITPLGNFLGLTETAVREFQTQHIDPKTKHQLEVDGIVGPATWRAIKNPSGKAQKNNFGSSFPPDLPPIRRATLEECERLYEGNMREIPAGSNWGDGIPQLGGRKGWPWCALFVTTVWRRAGVDIKRYASTYSLWQIAKKRGWFYPIGSHDPRAFMPGNALLWQHKRRGRWTRTGHISIIARPVIREDGSFKEANTFGGNEGHRLKFGHRKESSKDLIGTINPFPLGEDYDTRDQGAMIVFRISAEGSTR